MVFFSEGFTKSKLMVLYFLDALSIDLTKEQIATFSAAYELIPYFELQSAIYELEEEGFLAAVPRPYGQAYCLTQKGKETIAMFVERLPLSVREDLSGYADDCREKLRRQTQFSATSEKIGLSAYRANLRVMEPSGDILQISIVLPDAACAKHATSVWQDKAQTIYEQLLKELLEEE